MINYFFKYFTTFRNLIKLNEFNKISKTDVILMSHDNDLGYLYMNKRYATILDSLDFFLKQQNISTLSISRPFSRIYGNKSFSNSLSVNGIIQRAYFLEKLNRSFFYFTKYKSNLIVDAWTNILLKAGAKIVIAIQPSVELCLASKKNGIIICDYQHGVLSNQVGYYGTEYRKKFKNEGWPDHILCWNKYFENWVLKNIGLETTPIVLGNPWFLRIFKSGNENFPFLKDFNKLKYKNNALPKILVTLQWDFENLDRDVNEIGMKNELYKFIQNNTSKYIWYIRLHPNMLNDKQFIKKVGKFFNKFDNLEWEQASQLPLPLVLSIINIHITSYSAVTIEASWLGIRTALLFHEKESLHEYFHEQIESGYAELVYPTELNLGKWLNRNIGIKIKDNIQVGETDKLNIFIKRILTTN